MNILLTVLPLICGGIITAFLDVKMKFKSPVLYFFLGAVSVIGSVYIMIL